MDQSECTDLVSVPSTVEDSKDEEKPVIPHQAVEQDGSDTLEVDDSQYVSKLDALGPIILNTDGTMGRIHNWNEMSENEREMAFRLISKRNKARKEALLLQKNAGK